MAGLKRRLYGLPLLAPYRDWRTRTLARRLRPHPFGFTFAGSDELFDPAREPAERAAIARALGDADVFVDVGANQGIYTCLAAAAGHVVAAVEPERGNLRFLLANIAANRFAVEVYPLALGDRAGSVDLFGDGFTASMVGGWSQTAASFVQPVPVNTLDNLFADRWAGQRLLVKMDVEGAEGPVIRGAARMLARDPAPVWLIETFARRYDGAQTPNPDFVPLFAAMATAGYRASDIATGASVTPADAARLADAGGGAAAQGATYLFRRP